MSQGHSEAKLFGYLRREFDRQALQDGMQQCGLAMAGNRQIIDAIKDDITECPDIERERLVAYLAKNFSICGGDWDIEFGQLLIMWAVALEFIARQEVAA